MTVIALDPMSTSPSHIADVAATLAPAQPVVWEREDSSHVVYIWGYRLSAGVDRECGKRIAWAAVEPEPTGLTSFREDFRDLRHAKQWAVRVALLRFVTRAMKQTERG